MKLCLINSQIMDCLPEIVLNQKYTAFSCQQIFVSSLSYLYIYKEWKRLPFFLLDHTPDSCLVAQSCPILCNPTDKACQVSLFFTISQSLLKFISIESMMPSNHLTLCHPFLFLPSIFPSSRGISNESVFHIRWPKYWSFSFSISPSNE